MIRKQRAMTLIEMVICLAIISICLVALVRVSGNLPLFALRQGEDAILVEQVERLIVSLEAVPPKETDGTIEGPWRYHAFIEENRYVLEVWHDTNGERHELLLREGPL